MPPTFDKPGDGSEPVLPPREPRAGETPPVRRDPEPTPPPAREPGTPAPVHEPDPPPPPAREPEAPEPARREPPDDAPPPIEEPPPHPEPRAHDAGALAMRPRRDQAFEEEADAAAQMSFLDHLEELRWVLMHSVIATLAGAIAGWLLAPRVLEDIIARTVKHAVVMSPLEAFNERFKLALILGLFIALPIVFYRVWGFVLPGLFRKERVWVLPMAFASLVLFALGAWAAYGYVVPLVIDVLSGFQTASMIQQIRLGALLGFVYNMALACGVVMQLPLVTMTLTAIGLVTPGFLLRQWRYAIVAAFLATALITPGDVVTAQLIMGIPMALLYFISVGLSYLVARRRAEGERARAAQS